MFLLEVASFYNLLQNSFNFSSNFLLLLLARCILGQCGDGATGCSFANTGTSHNAMLKCECDTFGYETSPDGDKCEKSENCFTYLLHLTYICLIFELNYCFD